MDTKEQLKKQLENLKKSLGKSWISDDHIEAKIQDIEQELERRKRTA